MSFTTEREMHEPIKRYFEENGYQVTEEVERIDIVGIKRGETFVNTVGIEAKLGLPDWGDAFTKAVKAQQKCSEAYVAFPIEELKNKENREHLRLIRELCDARGIGILGVGKNTCKLVHDARPVLHMTAYRKIMDSIELKILSEKESFEGFEEDDFHCFLTPSGEPTDTDEKRRRRQVASIKMRFLINEVFSKLRSLFPGEFKGHKVGIPSPYGCWAFISSEKIEKIRPGLKNCVHFSHSIKSTGFYFRIHAEGRYNLSRKMSRPIEKIIVKMENNSKGFLAKFRECRLFEIRIGYEEDVGIFYPKKARDVKYIATILRDLKGKYVYFDARIPYGVSGKVVRSKELVNEIVEQTEKTKPFYDFIRN